MCIIQRAKEAGGGETLNGINSLVTTGWIH